MTDVATAKASGETSKTIPVSCTLRGGPRGFATLMVERCGDEIVLDAHVTGGSLIILNETAATALFDVLGAWLGRPARTRSLDPPGESQRKPQR